MTTVSSSTARHRSALPATGSPTAEQSKPARRKLVSILGPRPRSDGSDDPDSPSKKRKKVSFKMNLNMVIDIGSKSLEQAKREVRKALDAHARGDEEGYDYLKDIFINDRKRYLPPIAGDEDDALKPEELLVYIVAMTSCAPLLGKSCAGLIKMILGCAWLGRDEIFVKAYVQFLAALSSAHGSCLSQVLSMMVDKFALVRPSEWTVPDFPGVGRETMRQRLHVGLQYLLGIFPAARPIICSLVVSKYPYHEQPRRVHMAFIDNLFRLREYAPDLERDIMELITNQLVKIDVQMQLDLDDIDDDLTKAVLFQLRTASRNGEEDEEDESGDSDLESVLSDDSDYDEEANRIQSAKNNVRKMDGILETLFRFYTPLFSDPDSEKAVECFRLMLADFINIILPTYNSRHSQFLLFHFGQKSPRLIDTFLGTLMTIAGESNRPMVLRQSAIAYLASFVARGAHVSAELVRIIARTLWLNMDVFRANHEQTCRGPDLRRFAIYYEWTQGLMYLFCFRWRELVKAVPAAVDRDDPASYVGQDLVWVDDFRDAVRRNIRSKFNPLKVCAPNIVQEFAKLAWHLGLDYVYPVLDSNKNVHLAQFVSGAYSSGGALRDTGYDPQDEKWTHLEPNSQFDPYQLPGSRRWLEGDYLSWDPIPGLDRDDEGDDSDEVDMDDEEIIEEDTATDEENADN